MARHVKRGDSEDSVRILSEHKRSATPAVISANGPQRAELALAPILLSAARSRVQTCGSSVRWCGSKAVGRALPPHQFVNVTLADRQREPSEILVSQQLPRSSSIKKGSCGLLNIQTRENLLLHHAASEDQFRWIHTRSRTAILEFAPRHIKNRDIKWFRCQPGVHHNAPLFHMEMNS